MRKLAANMTKLLVKCRNEYWVISSPTNGSCNGEDWSIVCLNNTDNGYNAINALKAFTERYGPADWINSDINKH